MLAVYESLVRREIYRDCSYLVSKDPGLIVASAREEGVADQEALLLRLAGGLVVETCLTTPRLLGGDESGEGKGDWWEGEVRERDGE